jgi:hypothetical protein
MLDEMVQSGEASMEPYRYQQLIYLVVPVSLGIEFFINARNERIKGPDATLGSYALDFFGFLFTVGIPALFIFTIWAVATGSFNFKTGTLARLDRYGVMFMFLGAWWQVYMIGALRAARLSEKRTPWYVLGPTLVFGIFISILILWVSPFGLKWISVFWFVLITLVIGLLKPRPKTIEKLFWILAAITFLFMNVFFIWLEAII